MIKILRTICIAFMLTLVPIAVGAQCDILVDGSPLVCSDLYTNTLSPFVESGTAFVPMRAISEKFGVSYSYSEATNTLFIGSECEGAVYSEQINVYFNGNAVSFYNTNGEGLYPVIKNGEVYMPVRAVGNLFNKNVAWDNFNQTAVLTTPLKQDELAYLVNCVKNTDNLSNANQELSFSGKIDYNGKTLSEVEQSGTASYSPSVFSVSSFIDFDNLTNASYLGNGKYFIFTSGQKFATTPYMINALQNSLGDNSFSPLYVTLSLKGGYITDISLFVSSLLSYNSLSFSEEINISSHLVYESGFKFPSVPYPEQNSADGVAVFSENPQDAQTISDFTDELTRYLFTYSSTELMDLLYTDDHNSVIGNKTHNQQKLMLSLVEEKLISSYKHATGNYNVKSMVYVNNPKMYPNSPDKVAKVLLEIEYTDNVTSWKEDIEIILSKIDGKWYLNSSVIKNLM